MAQKARIPGVFKNVIAPVQAWLLTQGRCVGCGRDLSQGKRAKYQNNTEKATCECGRVFIHNTDNKKYRRALLEEI